jgi:hypothetical protein
MAEEQSTQLNRNGNRRGMSPKSRKNLEKGRQGNNHAKKDYSITRIVKEMIDDPAEERFLDVQDKDKGLTWRQAIALRMLRDGVGGKYGELLDRIEGKVAQPISGDKDNPLQVEVDAKGKLISAISRLASRTGSDAGNK